MVNKLMHTGTYCYARLCPVVAPILRQKRSPQHVTVSKALRIISLERQFVEEVVGIALRLIGRFLIDIVVSAIIEVMFKFPGNFICKPFTKKR